MIVNALAAAIFMSTRFIYRVATKAKLSSGLKSLNIKRLKFLVLL